MDIKKVSPLRKLIVILLLLSSIGLAGCEQPRSRTKGCDVVSKLRVTEIVSVQDLANKIKDNIMYVKKDGLCYAAVLSLADSSYPVVSITHIPCPEEEQ